MPRKPTSPWWRRLLHPEPRCTWPWCWRTATQHDSTCDGHHAADPWERL